MSDSERTEIFAAFIELSRRYPHWRVVQLVANVAGWADSDMWDAEDGQLLAAARSHLEGADGSPGSRAEYPATFASANR